MADFLFLITYPSLSDFSLQNPYLTHSYTDNDFHTQPKHILYE